MNISEELNIEKEETKEVEFPKENEEDVLVHNLDREESRPEAEETKKELQDEVANGLEHCREVAIENNYKEEPKPEAHDGAGKKINKFLGVNEKMILEEPSDILVEEFEDCYFKAVKEIKEILKKHGLTEEDLEDIVDEICTDSEEVEPLDEAIPSDLATTYKNASYKGVHNNNQDLQASNYREVTPEEAYKIYKKDPLSLRLIFNGKLIDFRDNGKPSLTHRDQWVKSDLAYKRSSGRVIYDTRRMPATHLFKNAEKIYVTDEKDHPKDQELLDSRSKNPESPNFRGDSSSSSTDLRGYSIDRGIREPDEWDIRQINRYIKREQDSLADIENNKDQYSEDDYNRYVANSKDALERYKKRLLDYENQQKDYNARLRYVDSANKLREPYKKYSELKANIDTLSRNVENARENIEKIKTSGSQEIIDIRDSYEKVREKINNLNRELDVLEIRLLTADEEDEAELKASEDRLNRISKDYESAVSDLEKLLGKK